MAFLVVLESVTPAERVAFILVALQDGITVTVFAFRIAGDRITHIVAPA